MPAVTTPDSGIPQLLEDWRRNSKQTPGERNLIRLVYWQAIILLIVLAYSWTRRGALVMLVVLNY